MLAGRRLVAVGDEASAVLLVEVGLRARRYRRRFARPPTGYEAAGVRACGAVGVYAVMPPAFLSRELIESNPLLTLLVLVAAAVLVHEAVRWIWRAVRGGGGGGGDPNVGDDA